MRQPDPGRLDQRVTLQQATRTADGLGGYVKGWSDVATLWARVEPLAGRERDMAQQVESPRDYRVTIRRRADVTTAHRLLWQGNALNIRFVADEGARALYLALDCERGVAT